MSDAEEILGRILDDVDDAKIDAWIRKLTDAGRDPAVYARALELKSKKLDGCDGFFIAMHRDNKEDEWLENQLKKVRRSEEKKVKSTWPYPEGHWACKECRGQGWLAPSRNALTEEQLAEYESHKDNGFVPVYYGEESQRIVFICRDCNPHGVVTESFQDKIHSFKRHPVGGTPFDFSNEVPF